MENKRNIRKALKAIEKLSTEMEQGMAMDNAMDGSGECGGIIAHGWSLWFNNQINKILAEAGVTLEEIKKTTDAWAKRELEMGPKKIFVSMFSRRSGMYKVTDYFDTRWGCINFELHQLNRY